MGFLEKIKKFYTLPNLRYTQKTRMIIKIALKR